VSGRRLLLLRHGRTAWNSVGRAQGHADVELDDLGHRQAAAVAPYLAGLRPVALWTSDLARARQTCGYLERATGLSAKADERLREFDVGARQGMTAAQFEAAFPEAYLDWASGDDLVPVPGSELTSEVAARMVPALRESLASLADGELGIVVTHGACLKVALLGLLGWSQSDGTRLASLGNCAWASVAEAGPGRRLRLEAYNRSVGADDGALTDG
jgi:broad specificity phosphatase PhoE